jgi:hypothetical protein
VPSLATVRVPVRSTAKVLADNRQIVGAGD